MWFRADGRDSRLDDLVVYDARYAWTNHYRLPLGNVAPPNDMAVTQ